jgi:hypothetical protein
VNSTFTTRILNTEVQIQQSMTARTKISYGTAKPRKNIHLNTCTDIVMRGHICFQTDSISDSTVVDAIFKRIWRKASDGECQCCRTLYER